MVLLEPTELVEKAVDSTNVSKVELHPAKTEAEEVTNLITELPSRLFISSIPPDASRKKLEAVSFIPLSRFGTLNESV